jgi:hypothetical protein
MLKIFLQLKGPITSVLATQEWDESVKANLTSDKADWQCLEEIETFFELFRRLTIESQAGSYLILHNTIPDYLFLIRQMKVHASDSTKPILQLASNAAWEILNDYFKKSMATRYLFIATIIDPRYKLAVFEHLFAAEGGVRSSLYKKGKAHFETIYSQFKSRSNSIRIFDKEESRFDSDGYLIETAEPIDDFQSNPYYGYDDFLSTLPSRPATLQNEVSQYFSSDYLPRIATHEEIRI